MKVFQHIAKCIHIISQLCSPDIIQGRKPTRQYELSGGITLLSPAYLLSIKRHSFHKVMPDHYKHGKIYYHPARAITLTVQLPLLLLYSKLQNDEVEETYIPPLLFRRFPPQANYQALTGPRILLPSVSFFQDSTQTSTWYGWA